MPIILIFPWKEKNFSKKHFMIFQKHFQTKTFRQPEFNSLLWKNFLSLRSLQRKLWQSPKNFCHCEVCDSKLWQSPDLNCDYHLSIKFTLCSKKIATPCIRKARNDRENKSFVIAKKLPPYTNTSVFVFRQPEFNSSLRRLHKQTITIF